MNIVLNTASVKCLNGVAGDMESRYSVICGMLTKNDGKLVIMLYHIITTRNEWMLQNNVQDCLYILPERFHFLYTWY